MRIQRHTRNILLLFSNLLSLLGHINTAKAADKESIPTPRQNVTLRISANEFDTSDLSSNTMSAYGIHQFRINSLLRKYGVIINVSSQIQIHQEENFIDITCFDCRIQRFNYELAKEKVDNKGG